MIAVVTGGSGFIGQNLVRRLLTDGHQVRCLVRADSGPTPEAATRVTVRFDDGRSLLECPALDGAHVIYHLAGATRAPSAEAFDAANVMATRHLLAAVIARKLYPKIVFVSSQAAAGPAKSLDHPVTEDMPSRPVEPYGASKLRAERVVREASDRVAATIVRPCSVFGAHDRDFFPLFRMVRRGLVLYPGTADHWLSLLHVDDVVDGLLAAGRRDTSVCRTFFLSSAEPLQWRALGEEISNVVGRQVRHLNVPAPIVDVVSAFGELLGRGGLPMPLANRSKAALARQPLWICSAARAREELAFRPTRSLPDALRDTYNWYRQSGWLRDSRRVVPAVA